VRALTKAITINDNTEPGDKKPSGSDYFVDNGEIGRLMQNSVARRHKPVVRLQSRCFMLFCLRGEPRGLDVSVFAPPGLLRFARKDRGYGVDFGVVHGDGSPKANTPAEYDTP